MSGFFVVILLFLLLLVLMGLLIGSVKVPRAVYLTAVTATVSAWFIGLLLDANLDLHPEGFLALRVLLPVLAMGLCILRVLLNRPQD